MGCHPGDDIPGGRDAGPSDAAADAATTDAASSDAAVGSSLACYIAGQMRCKEFPQATADQEANLPVECSSDSGKLTSPAACPNAGFVGKCTVGTGVGREVRRWYTGADVVYQQDFCVTTAMGLWSTTF